MTPILNKIYRFLTVASLLFLMAACNDGFDVPENLVPDSPGTITLHLKSSNLTRSEDSDNASNPETAIKNLCIVFYKKSLGGGLTPGGGLMSLDETSQDERTLEMIVIPESDLVDVNDQYTYTLRLTDERKKKFFGENGEDDCDFFVLANITDLDNVPENVTAEELKEWVIKTDFTKPQASFVMAGEGTVEYTSLSTGGKKGSASGSALLIRAAAKIQLNVKFTESVTVNEEKWKPVEGGIKVLINNGVKESIAVPEGLNGMPWKPGLTQDPTQEPSSPDDELEMLSDMDDEGENASDPYYSSSLKNAGSVRSLSKATSSEGNPDYPYQMDVPFYTYPNAWEESAEETHKTTLTLVVPWHKDGDPEGSNYTFYYQVPVTPDITFITRNTSYNIYLNVGMLGSLVPDEPLELTELTYKIVDWSDENINVEINDYRYLVVNPNVYTINNEEEFSIPFYTSHECEIINFTMTYQRFNYPTNGSGEVIEIPISQNVIKASNTNSNKMCTYDIVRDPITDQWTIQINHPMVIWTPQNASGGDVSLTETGQIADDGSVDKAKLDVAINSIVRYRYPDKPEQAYYPYTFHLTIRHKDNYAFSEDVVITQYPGMYIKADKNFGGEYLSYDPNSITAVEPKPYNYGYVYLNPQKEETEGGIVWRNADTWGTAPDIKDEQTSPTDVISQYRAYYEKGLGGLKKYEGPQTTGAVANPNMYILNITQLSASGTQSDYIIGDPRSKAVNNELTNESMIKGSPSPAGEWCQTANALYGSQQRTLTYYYPTDESDACKMMVAPKLRISSAFGFVRRTTDIVDCTMGRRRAATYQEQGYPAGRWRLPTFGEVQFIVTLSKEGKIPVLFNKDVSYLTAQGAYTVQENGTLIPTVCEPQNGYYGSTDRGIPFYVRYSTLSGGEWKAISTNGVNVRPVYDEWYWEQQDNYKLNKDDNGGYVYTLGDVPIKFIQTTE